LAALIPAGQPRITAPLKLTQMYPDNALFWDTFLNHDANADTPAQMWWAKNKVPGSNIPESMIDDNDPNSSSENGLLCHSEFPERRFRGSSGNRFGDSTDQTKNPNGPICYPSDAWLNEPGFAYSSNTDFASRTEWNSGNARFRHNGLACNVAFVDGSVKTFFVNTRKVVAGTGNHVFYDNEFRRYMLMTRWLPGFKDNMSAGGPSH